MNRGLTNNRCHCEPEGRGNPAFLFTIIVIIALIIPLPAFAGVWKGLKTNKNAIEASKPGVSKTYSCFYNQLQTNLKFKFFNHTIINNTTKTTCPSGYYCLDPAINQPIDDSSAKIQTPSGHAECVKADDVLPTSLCKDENTKTMIAEIPDLGSGKVDFYVHVPCSKEKPFCFGGECVKHLPNCIDSDSDKGAKPWEIGKETELMLKWKNGEADGKLGISIVKAGTVSVGGVKTNDRCKGGMLMEEACRADGTPIEIGIDCKTALPDKDNPAKGAKCNDKDKDGNLKPAHCDTTGVNPPDKDGDGITDILDNCPDVINQDQADKDYDSLGNVCDNCPKKANAGQQDLDGDKVGDVCDNCPDKPNPDKADLDNDTIGDACDNCPKDPNPDQKDSNKNDVGDKCEMVTFAKIYDYLISRGESVEQTANDGGYVVLGDTSTEYKNYPTESIVILRLDLNGNTIWQKTLGDYNFFEPASIQQTIDEGYIIIGSRYSFTNKSDDLWIVKLDSNGEIMWQKAYGDDLEEYGKSIQQTADGGYIAAGSSKAEDKMWWILRLGPNGEILWQKKYIGIEMWAHINEIQLTDDGGYIAVGKNNLKPFTMLILKLDSKGGILWQKEYFSIMSYFSPDAYSTQQTDDGGYIIAGDAMTSANATELLVLKLDSNGVILWQKSYGGDNNGYDSPSSIQQTDDGGYIVAGWTSSFGAGAKDAWILKLDKDGDPIWENTYGTPYNDVANSIQQTNDGGYIVTGDTQFFGTGEADSNIWVIKLDPGGNIGGCPKGVIKPTAAVIKKTDLSEKTTSITSVPTSIQPKDTGAEIINTSANIETQCSGD